MKAILAGALIIALGIAGLSLWGKVHAQRMAFTSSQIFIEGTPVCVMQHGGEIIASLGMCGTPEGASPEEGIGSGGVFHRGRPSPRDLHPDLPPGHPPIDSPTDLEEGRRILI